MFRTLVFLFLSAALIPAESPVFPYGAVYFRKSNPPPEDWARDHAAAAKLGMNMFRHWVMWSAVEVAPGKYDWRDYDAQLDLAAKNNLRVVIAEMITAAPEWAFDKYPHARYLASDGSLTHSGISGSSATGGFPGLCLDNEDVRGLAEKWLAALAGRYKDHPALYGYDIWNEHTYPGGTPQKMNCYCDATQRKFREWLKKKYGTVESLGKAWYRYSYSDWEHVHPPRSFQGYPESLDWLEFRIDNAFRLANWRAGLIRRLDPDTHVVAHGVASSLEGLPSASYDEWRSAAGVETWGFTWVASRKGSEPWKQFHAVDLVRAGSRGKPFWHAEAQAGPLWMQPQVTGRPRDDGRITEPNDVRLWNLLSIAGGATGILYPRLRPLLDGPLFGAFGAFAMDGSLTPRAEMAGKVARWANSNPGLWKSRPVKGDVGIVWIPETQIFNYVQQGSTAYYAESARGAYQAFFDSNIQADFVHIDHIQEYPLIYLPYPVHLKEETSRKLAAYVHQGGMLVSEGLPAYFGERGKVGAQQPNHGLDTLFGAREAYVEFTPDLLEDLTLTVRGQRIHGRFFLQEYSLTTGKPAGAYQSGRIAAVENQVAKGRTLLIGTFPGAGYFRHHDAQTKSFFSGLLDWAGIRQGLRTSDPMVKARLHKGGGGPVLYVVNPTRQDRPVIVYLSDSFRYGKDVWQDRPVKVDRQRVELTVEERNAAVVRLD
ncbi:MAG: alpha-amylase family protein [Bryobacteraceae bacterium]|nr:alpha-amylase family protein [Bryobacteraceae bacterium]